VSFKGKAVCVTGAGGSIGSEICRRLLTHGVTKLTLLSLTEAGLYNIERELRPIATAQGCELLPVLGSVTDQALLRETLPGTDLVIHAAAHKHVPLCEQNPIAAIENNVGGTYKLLLESALASVQQFVLISSDKAVNPASVMGATKRVAELVVRYSVPAMSQMIRIVVRFGNVLDSAGSVLPLWREQIARGGPITLTDGNCERYFMSIPGAVDLVLGAASLEQNGTFVLDMGAPRKMIDMAYEFLAAHYADLGLVVCEEYPIKFTGLRPGEKLTEELNYGGSLQPTGVERVNRVTEPDSGLAVGDFLGLFNATRMRNKKDALAKLWEIVK